MVPLNKAAEALPKLGRLSSPVTRRVMPALTRLLSSWFLLTCKTDKACTVVWLPRTSPTELKELPSYFMRNAVPLAALPATQNCEASAFAGASAVTNPGTLEDALSVDHTVLDAS